MSLLGVVLTGGKSSRMGSDKGLLTDDHGNTWAGRSFALLQKFCSEVVVSVNPDQYEQYQSVFLPHQLVTDIESLPVRGPLLGLLSVHLKFPSRDILLLASDMIDMDLRVLQNLVSLYQHDQSREAYVFFHAEGMEPLCSIFTEAALSRVAHRYRLGELNRYSMKFLLKELNTELIPLPEGWKTFFRNFNSPDELNRL